ncbi:DUF4870 family protein [Cycloclasticus pugetii]|uniref:DUF4870 family protein n=1 Tax=Cycloclasticus pugetii TaxID=34068 RepID=UPI00091AB35A|nr:hypothetical protein [Cycloclasticus pugetii]SHJ34174.1 Uncharacterized membrane protein [Cycloclasticus pugetii]
MNKPIAQLGPSTDRTAKTIYTLYLVGLVFGITSIIGIVMAYLNQNDSPEWLKSHYRFQIRTFWIGILFILVGTLLASVLIGYLVLMFSVVWLIIRCIKGLKLLEQQQEYPNPTTWLF